MIKRSDIFCSEKMTFRQQKWKIFSRRVLTLKIASAQAVRTSINFPSQDTFPDNQISSRHTTPKLKPISWNKHYAQYPWVLRWSLEKKRVNLWPFRRNGITENSRSIRVDGKTDATRAPKAIM